MTKDIPLRTQIEPETRTGLCDFLDQFDSGHVFGVNYEREGAEYPHFRVVTAIEKVRPAAVPIDQAATFDMEVVETGEDFDAELRLTIEDINYIRVAEPPEEVYTGQQGLS